MFPAAILCSCGAESPFSQEENGNKVMCEFHKSSLDLDVRTDNVVVNSPSRAGANEIALDDFTVWFYKDGSDTPVSHYKFGEMSDVILLEKGEYVVKATFGEDVEAEWETPYFAGSSKSFSVNPNEITTDIGVIPCKLQNVKVSIVFDPELANATGDDASVEVKVSNGKSLKFSKTETRNGYFRLGSEKTLVATFEGTLDGAKTSESKSLDNIEAGNHYRITFRKHIHGNDNHGSVSGDVSISASVDVENIDKNVTLEEQNKPLEDEMRPKEEDPENPDGPGKEDPVGPQITPQGKITFDDWNVNPDACILNVHSNTGITAFDVEIKSEILTPEELSSVGLASNLDLITGTDPDGKDLSEGLSNLGFPIKDQVENQKDIEFDITKFMPMLKMLGMGEGVRDHIFVLKVSDSEGMNSIELKIRITD